MKLSCDALKAVEQSKATIANLTSKKFAEKVDRLTDDTDIVTSKVRKMDAAIKLLSIGVSQKQITKLLEQNEIIRFANFVLN